MKSVFWPSMAVMVLAGTAVAEEKRGAEAHEHGHGTFSMVIEDDHAVIEVAVPAFDIVGFEHAPSTAAQRIAMADAAATLSRPDILFAIPESAGCAIGQVEIGFGATGGHRHEHRLDQHLDDVEAVQTVRGRAGSAALIREGHSQITAALPDRRQGLLGLTFGKRDAYARVSAGNLRQGPRHDGCRR